MRDGAEIVKPVDPDEMQLIWTEFARVDRNGGVLEVTTKPRRGCSETTRPACQHPTSLIAIFSTVTHSFIYATCIVSLTLFLKLEIISTP